MHLLNTVSGCIKAHDIGYALEAVVFHRYFFPSSALNNFCVSSIRLSLSWFIWSTATGASNRYFRRFFVVVVVVGSGDRFLLTPDILLTSGVLLQLFSTRCRKSDDSGQ